jgi:hypothetical protein
MNDENRKFCTSCQSMRALEGGVMKETRGVPRWMCAPCVERKTESIYKNRSTDTVYIPRKHYD